MLEFGWNACGQVIAGIIELSEQSPAVCQGYISCSRVIWTYLANCFLHCPSRSIPDMEVRQAAHAHVPKDLAATGADVWRCWSPGPELIVIHRHFRREVREPKKIGGQLARSPWLFRNPAGACLYCGFAGPNWRAYMYPFKSTYLHLLKRACGDF